jgi:hypothetical protein
MRVNTETDDDGGSGGGGCGNKIIRKILPDIKCGNARIKTARLNFKILV